jgi:hypothetical protein
VCSVTFSQLCLVNKSIQIINTHPTFRKCHCMNYTWWTFFVIVHASPNTKHCTTYSRHQTLHDLQQTPNTARPTADTNRQPFCDPLLCILRHSINFFIIRLAEGSKPAVLTTLVQAKLPRCKNSDCRVLHQCTKIKYG